MATARDVLSPYDTLLKRWLPSDLTRGPVSAFAAHAGVGPTVPGGALFAFWQGVYHLYGQWHGRGGAQNLTDALVARLTSPRRPAPMLGAGRADRDSQRPGRRPSSSKAANASRRRPS